MRFLQFYLVMNLLFPVTAFSDNRIRILIIDTGVDAHNQTLSQVFCPKEESLDATLGIRGIPADTIGHGTHVAGIIRALSGSKGYCLAFCKYYLESNPGEINMNNTVRCLRHAQTIGARYVNYSSGGSMFEEKEKLAIKELNAKIFVAAGNFNENIDGPPRKYYPAAYRLSNEIIVGSYNSKCNKALTSNYGVGVVFMFGEPVYSSLSYGRRGFMGGTSMATAVATGSSLRRILGLPSLSTCQDYSNFLLKFWSSH